VVPLVLISTTRGGFVVVVVGSSGSSGSGWAAPWALRCYVCVIFGRWGGWRRWRGGMRLWTSASCQDPSTSFAPTRCSPITPSCVVASPPNPGAQSTCRIFTLKRTPPLSVGRAAGAVHGAAVCARAPGHQSGLPPQPRAGRLDRRRGARTHHLPPSPARIVSRTRAHTPTTGS
jgi:hypothetical protein